MSCTYLRLLQYMETIKRLFKFVAIIPVNFCNKLFYPKFRGQLSLYSPFVAFRYGAIQKIVGVNRNVPWPVHWSSQIRSIKNIDPGSRAPGMSMGCFIDGRNGIIIGKNVWIGPRVSIISMNHNSNCFTRYNHSEPIVIGDNSWLGANSIILPSVVLGEHTVVAAGSVVTKSFPQGNQIVGGNPASVIKRLAQYFE